MIQRARELENWINDFNLPASVWLGGFFNPQSFLTAIMQQTARKVSHFKRLHYNYDCHFFLMSKSTYTVLQF